MNIPTPDELARGTGQPTTRRNQFQFLLDVAGRHWLVIVIAIFIGAVAWPLFNRFVNPMPEPRYTAETKIGIKKSLYDRGILGGIGSRFDVVPLDPRLLVNRLREETSWADDVALAMVQRDITQAERYAGLYSEDELRRLANRIRGAVRFQDSPNSDLITIRAMGASENESRELAELTARVVIERNREYINQEEQRIHQYVLEQIDDLRVRLDSAETAEWSFRQQIGFRTDDAFIRDMDAMNEEMNAAETTRAELIAKMAKIEEELQDKNERLPEALGQLSDSLVNRLIGELEELLQEQLVMSITYTPEFPGLQLIAEEIEEKRRAIIEAVRQIDQNVQGGSSLWADRRQLREQYLQHQLEITALDIRVKTIEDYLNDMVARLPELAEKSRHHARLVHEAEQLRSQFETLREREFDIRTAMQRDSGQVERRAGVAITFDAGPVGEMQWWVGALVGGLVGFFFGLALAFLWEQMDTSIRSMEDVTEHLGLEVIGQVPRMRFVMEAGGRPRRGTGTNVTLTGDKGVDPSIVTRHDPKSPVSEAYRTLRTNFQLTTFQIRPRTLMITSAVPGEGKTTTAVNLGVTMADSGVRTLIIDTDLRRPNVHHVLKMERGLGLSDVLRDKLDVRAVIRETRVPNLWMVSSGRVPPNPSELIGSEAMRRLMAELGGTFDLVICDAPSVLVVTDPVLLSTTMDTCMLVVAVNTARRETILRAKRLLEQTQVNIAGVAVNGLEAGRRNYYYYYYYYDDRARRKAWYHV